MSWLSKCSYLDSREWKIIFSQIYWEQCHSAITISAYSVCFVFLILPYRPRVWLCGAVTHERRVGNYKRAPCICSRTFQDLLEIRPVSSSCCCCLLLCLPAAKMQNFLKILTPVLIIHNPHPTPALSHIQNTPPSRHYGSADQLQQAQDQFLERYWINVTAANTHIEAAALISRPLK